MTNLFGRVVDWLNLEPAQESRGADIAAGPDIERANLLSGTGIPLGYRVASGKPAPVEKWKFQPLHYAGENHLITVGKPGTGKGRDIIIPALLEYPGSCIVIDPKGQNAAVTARRRRELGHDVRIINPFQVFKKRLGASTQYNPLERLNPYADSFVADVRSFAQALIIPQGKDPHWSDAARELITCLIMHVCLTCKGEERTLQQVRKLLLLPICEPDEDGNSQGFEKHVETMMASAFAPLAQKAGQFSEVSNELKSILSTARTQLAFLDDPAITENLSGSGFSFAWMKRRPISVYLVLPFKQIEAQARWLRLLITSAVEELTEEPRPGDRRVLFILDEFAQLGRLQAIERALALVRGYGVQLWPFLQDLPQLKSVYPDRWESFLATAGIQQFFAPNDAQTAEYISRRCGTRLMRHKSFSESQSNGGSSSSTSFADQREPLFQPWDLYGEPNSGQFLFVEGLSPVVWCLKKPYYASCGDIPDMRCFADPDPFHIKEGSPNAGDDQQEEMPKLPKEGEVAA